jgi:hypothetical protein
MMSNGWDLEIFGMAGHPWCDAGCPIGAIGGPAKSQRGSSFWAGRITDHEFLRKNSFSVETYLFRKKFTFHLKGDLSRKIGPFGYMRRYSV